MRAPTLVMTALLLFALPLHAESWSAAYLRGVAAGQKNDWSSCSDAMQKAIAQKNKEDEKARVGKQGLPYLPYFWLGLARVNAGDVQGGLDALRRSEAQGAVQKSVHYAELRSAITRAESKKSAPVTTDAAVLTASEKAITRAMTGQMEATAAGASRLESYRRAAQKLREAFEAKRGSQLDQASRLATEAADLFHAATAEEKKRRSATAATRAGSKVVETPVAASPQVVTAAAVPAEQPVAMPAIPPQGTVARDEEEMSVVPPTSDATPQRPVVSAEQRGLLRAAFREWRSGRLERAESLLSNVLASNQSMHEALMLRGCTRYTRAVLTGSRVLEAQAAADFRAAVRIDPSSRLDPRLFSPKMLAFFAAVKRRG